METQKPACDDIQCPYNKDGLCEKRPESSKDISVRMLASECKSFYQVFLDTETHVMPHLEKLKQGVFDEKALEESNLYHIPYVVNGSFAAELAIKYLLELANIDYSKGNKGHNLRYLFDLLLLNKGAIRQDRENIIALLCSDGHQTLETLKLNIAAWSDCYNRYRYLYSVDGAGTNHVFPLFVHTVCEYVISKSKQAEEKDEC